MVAEQTPASADELKARLARMRADSLFVLAEKERRIADGAVASWRSVSVPPASSSRGAGRDERRVEERLRG